MREEGRARRKENRVGHEEKRAGQKKSRAGHKKQPAGRKEDALRHTPPAGGGAQAHERACAGPGVLRRSTPVPGPAPSPPRHRRAGLGRRSGRVGVEARRGLQLGAPN